MAAFHKQRLRDRARDWEDMDKPHRKEKKNVTLEKNKQKKTTGVPSRDEQKFIKNDIFDA